MNIIFAEKRELWSCELIKMVRCECECVNAFVFLSLFECLSMITLLMFYVISVYSLYYSETSIKRTPSGPS